jgi:hypothetical protein
MWGDVGRCGEMPSTFHVHTWEVGLRLELELGIGIGLGFGLGLGLGLAEP